MAVESEMCYDNLRVKWVITGCKLCQCNVCARNHCTSSGLFTIWCSSLLLLLLRWIWFLVWSLIILLIYVQKNKEMMKYFEIHVSFVVRLNLCTVIKVNVFSFIGLDRKSFDNKHVTFEDHVHKVHNMWNYVYFMVLIHVKDPTEYTGPESYVHEMIEVRICSSQSRLKSECCFFLAKKSRMVSAYANEKFG